MGQARRDSDDLSRRAGAAYLDTFDANMLGNGVFPAILHQDPRYFRLGHGGFRHRLLYAIAATFRCKHDNTGKWEPYYSNIMGNIASGALSNLYYPSGNTDDFYNLYGYLLSQVMVQALKQCGNDLSRENIMKQVLNLNMDSPLLLPGVCVHIRASLITP